MNGQGLFSDIQVPYIVIIWVVGKSALFIEISHFLNRCGLLHKRQRIMLCIACCYVMVKAHTHTLIFRELAPESADSSSESADSSSDAPVGM